MPDGTQERTDLELHREIQLDLAAAPCEPYRVVEAGVEIDPTSGSITAACYTPQGAAITGGVTATIAGKLCTFTFNTTLADFALGEYYRLEFTLTKTAVDYRRWFYFDVVTQPLVWLLSGDHFNPDCRPAKGETDHSRVINDAKRYLVNHMRRWLKLNGNYEFSRLRPAWVKSPEQIFELHRAYAHYLYYKENFHMRDDGMHVRMLEYKEEYETQFPIIMGALVLDMDQDKLIGAEESKPKLPFFNRTSPTFETGGYSSENQG